MTHRSDKPDADERAVSPVIGVILMVAITVILAAVIGTFVLDLGQQTGEVAPQTSLSVDVDTANNNYTLSHDGGDSLEATQSRVTLTNEANGTVTTWDVGASTDVFQVGEQADFSVDGSGIVTGWGLANGTPTQTLDSGTQYTVKVIDTESQKVIFSTKFTA